MTPDHDFGVCRLSVVPIWSEAREGFQLSQLLFGEVYEVITTSKDRKRIQIKTNYDEVQGWIDAHHHVMVTPEYFVQATHADFKITTDIVSTILYKKNPLPIVIGSIVPISTSELFKLDHQFAFNGEAKPISQKRNGDFIETIACRYLNAPQVAGGKSPFGICAHGLVQMVFKICGYALPWSPEQQVMAGKKVEDTAHATKGDIAFFKDKSGQIIHTGIVLGDNKIIHASGHVRIDHLTEEGIVQQETKLRTFSLAFIRHLIS
ncbi:MAG: C40 family peptidase [Bacteroidetes bacterium]|nr:C40 family peptidase [Bacteroidota bacterium]MBS1541339.1 C40 family peptidase [Bacteroidota bacterium]